MVGLLLLVVALICFLAEAAGADGLDFIALGLAFLTLALIVRSPRLERRVP